MMSQHQLARRLFIGMIALLVLNACSIRQYAVEMIGDVLASGDSSYESDNDIELVGEALPSSLKLLDSLLAESPDHPGLLLAASRAYLLYAYGYVQFAADQAVYDDPDRMRYLRGRARHLYLRAFDYALHGLEIAYRPLRQELHRDPVRAVAYLGEQEPEYEVPLLYSAAAALGLAISVSKTEPGLVARLPEVEAMLDRALQLQEDWEAGALHEFKIKLLAANKPLQHESLIRQHYQRALALSHGTRASLYLTLAEAIAIPKQDRKAFRELLGKALAIDPDAQPQSRLLTLLAQRRARWLLQHIDDLIL